MSVSIIDNSFWCSRMQRNTKCMCMFDSLPSPLPPLSSLIDPPPLSSFSSPFPLYPSSPPPSLIDPPPPPPLFSP